MYKQVLDPVGDSLFLSALVALLPLITLFVLLGGLKMKSHWAGLISLAVAILVAIFFWSMPAGQAIDAGLEGAAFGLFPIMWIVCQRHLDLQDDRGERALRGAPAVLRRDLRRPAHPGRDHRLLASARCWRRWPASARRWRSPPTMLVAFGFKPIKAAAVALVANTAPVAFGAIAIPIVTLAGLTEIPKEDLGAMVGRQTPLLAVFVPLILVGMVDGVRGSGPSGPPRWSAACRSPIGQFVCSNYISVELTDIVASLLSVGAMVAFLRVWQPGDPLIAEGGQGQRPAGDRGRRDRRRDPRGRGPTTGGHRARTPARTSSAPTRPT